MLILFSLACCPPRLPPASPLTNSCLTYLLYQTLILIVVLSFVLYCIMRLESRMQTPNCACVASGRPGCMHAHIILCMVVIGFPTALQSSTTAVRYSPYVCHAQQCCTLINNYYSLSCTTSYACMNFTKKIATVIIIDSTK